MKRLIIIFLVLISLTSYSQGKYPITVSGSGGGGSAADSSVFATRYFVDTAKSNLRNSIALKMAYTDTAVMLAAYRTKIQTNIDSIAAHNTRIGAVTTSNAGKADSTAFVHKLYNLDEVITGVKSLPSNPIFNSTIKGQILYAGTGGKISGDTSKLYTDSSTGSFGIGTSVFSYNQIYSNVSTAKVLIKGKNSGNWNLSSMPFSIIDSLYRPTLEVDATGRINSFDYSGQGGVAVLYNRGTAANNNVAGHYAFAAKNNAGNENTIGYLKGYITDITAASVSSKLEFAWMTAANTTGGYTQPNATMTLDNNGLRTTSQIPLRTGSSTTNYQFEIQKNQNAGVQGQITNTTSGTGAFESFQLSEEGTTATKSTNIYHFNSGYTASGVLQPSSGLIGSSDVGGFYMGTWDASAKLHFFTGGLTAGAEAMTINASQRVGIGFTAPTATLHLKSGTTTASSAPLKLANVAPALNTTAEKYAVEVDSSTGGGNIYYTNASATRYTLAKTLTATGTLDFASTNAQNSSDLTITVTGAVTGDAVILGVPDGSTLTNSSFSAWVSANDTVKIRFNNYSSGALDPTSGTFRVSVLKY